jgi:hypothetical protein
VRLTYGYNVVPSHVAIRKLQLVLLKIGLLLGVNFVIGTYSSCQQSGALWKADVTTSEKHSNDDFLFNVLIGAEGMARAVSLSSLLATLT